MLLGGSVGTSGYGDNKNDGERGPSAGAGNMARWLSRADPHRGARGGHSAFPAWCVTVYYSGCGWCPVSELPGRSQPARVLAFQHTTAKKPECHVTMTASCQRRAIVIGGSIAGLFAAHVLLRRGWRVDVLERSAGELAGRGAGIVAQPELPAALAAAGMSDVGELGVRVEARILLDRAGRELIRHDCPQTVTSWEHLHGLLRARLPDEHYHAGCELAVIETTDGQTLARLTDGSAREADLIVGADGIRSTVRQQLFPEARLEYAGYVAWRGLIDERALSPATHQRIFWTMAFGLPPGEQFIGYPVTGANDEMAAGNLRYNIVWYRPADEARELKRLLTDTLGRLHSVSIPPPLIRPEVRAELIDAASRLLAPEFREVVALSPQLFLQPIYDLESTRIAAGRVAIIGDAAFVARPHVAAGVIKAADDMLAMVRALEEEHSVEAALMRYEAERLAVGRRIIARARQMGASYGRARPRVRLPHPPAMTRPMRGPCSRIPR